MHVILKDFKTYSKRDHVHSKDEIEDIVKDLTGTINENKKNTDKNKRLADNLKLDLDIYKYNQEEKFNYFYDKKETQKNCRKCRKQ